MVSIGAISSGRSGRSEKFFRACRSVPDNIVLIGFSGTGKTTVGRALSARLAWEFKDTDQAIVDRFGRSIASVFRDDGEIIFRAAERDAIVEACDGTGRVISVGGGAPVDPSNRELLRA